MLTQKLFFAWLQVRLIEASCSLSAAEHQMLRGNPVGYLRMVAMDPNDDRRIDAVQRLGKIASGDQLLGDTLFAEVRFTTEDREMALQALKELQKLTSPSDLDVKNLATKKLDRYHRQQKLEFRFPNDARSYWNLSPKSLGCCR